MTEVYYVANEKQYRKLLINLTKDCEEFEELETLGINGCDYIESQFGECQCSYCDLDVCILMHGHLEDKDAADHLTIDEQEFPAILVIADTYYKSDKVTLIPVRETKENTKYGYGEF